MIPARMATILADVLPMTAASVVASLGTEVPFGSGICSICFRLVAVESGRNVTHVKFLRCISLALAALALGFIQSNIMCVQQAIHLCYAVAQLNEARHTGNYITPEIVCLVISQTIGLLEGGKNRPVLAPLRGLIGVP